MKTVVATELQILMILLLLLLLPPPLHHLLQLLLDELGLVLAVEPCRWKLRAQVVFVVKRRIHLSTPTWFLILVASAVVDR